MENKRKEEIIKAKEEIMNARNELDKEIKERRGEIQRKEKSQTLLEFGIIYLEFIVL